MFLRKTHVSSTLRVPPCALLKEGKERDDRFETEAFIKVRRTCTYIYTPQKKLRTTIAWQYFEKVHLLILCTLKNDVY